jgi:uracil-DNA glycosylase family 4
MPSNRTPSMEPAQAALQRLLEELRAVVEYQRSAGVESFPQREQTQPVAREAEHGRGAVDGSGARTGPPGPRAPAAANVGTPAPPVAPAAAAAAVSDLFTAPGVRRATTLEELRTELGDCRRCKLWPGRTHIVFGVGNPDAAVMFVGEGPGRDEDLQAEPFVGKAGKLLTEIITKGMKKRRQDVYIANVIKCRPPENRNPEPDEIAACQPFLLRQIEIVRPKVLVALGTFAAQTLLGTRVPISRLRGHWYDYHGIRLMPTLHPAYLLRNPNDKRLVWEDVKMVLRELEASA